MKKIFIASDHSGLNEKHIIIEYIRNNYKNMEIIDCGPNTDKSCDYPDYAKKVCNNIQDDSMGILICGTGVGMSIVANRFTNIRCALCNSIEVAKLSREHNNANVIAIGCRTQKKISILLIIKTFLETKFSNADRHIARIKKI